MSWRCHVGFKTGFKVSCTVVLSCETHLPPLQWDFLLSLSLHGTVCTGLHQSDQIQMIGKQESTNIFVSNHLYLISLVI